MTSLQDMANDTEKRRKIAKAFSPRVASSIYDEDSSTLEDSANSQPDGAEGVPIPLPEHKQFGQDPDPRARVRWERKKVIQLVKRGGRTTRAERIRAAEREVTLRGPWLRTSTKKLGGLARQIAGKTLDEAMVQMRFSRKKWAAKVNDHLDYSRDVAVAVHGMGLGEANGEAPLAKPVLLVLKDGRKVKVTDPTNIYIDQAWVNRGRYVLGRILRHGRGRKSPAYTPHSSISVRLKEEKTRIRKQEDRELREIRAKPWVHHPDKPLYGQRQYYSW